MEDILEPQQATTTPLARSGGRNVLQIMWQRRALILFGLVLGITVGVLAFSQRSPVYKASAQVLVVKKQANALPVAGGDPRVAVMDDYVATHLIVIRSPILVSMAVKKRNLGGLKSLQGRDPVGTIQAGLVATREGSKDNSTGPGNNVLNLSYSGSDPGDVETILNSVIESYKDFLDETYQNTSETTVGLIQTAVETLKQDYSRKNEEYRAFRHSCPVPVFADTGVPIHQSKIVEYQRKETESNEQVMAIQKRIEEVEKAIKEKQPRDVILALAERRYDKGAANSKSNAAALETALFSLMQKEADLILFFGEDHPDVVRVRENMKMTRDFYRRLDDISRDGETVTKSNDPVENVLQALRLEHRLAIINHESNKGLLEAAMKKARDVESYYERDKGFRDEITNIQLILNATLKRLGEINLVRGYGGFDAKALTPPGPGGKVSPVLWQFLMMGAVLGFGLAAASAYLLDLADKSFRNPDEIRRRLGLPIVGHVSYVLASADPVGTVDGAGNVVELDPSLIALHQPMTPAAEGFRGIRTALFFKTHGQRHTVIQITSPNMGDGKTTLISNLAVSIAQSGRKVLVVDADLRRPRVHRVFGLAGKVGLAEVIAGTAELDEAIQITVVPNLSVLPCGRRPQNPAELLTSPRFEDVIDDLRGAFDYVLVDTPPLLAVSDPCIVAPRVDGLLLTIRLSKNGRPAAERARDLLVGLKVNCFGAVVNGVGKHGSMTGYGYEHYHYADEYTSGYSTTDEVNTEIPHEKPKTLEAAESATRADATPVGHPQPILTGSKESSANGHATHALTGG